MSEMPLPEPAVKPILTNGFHGAAGVRMDGPGRVAARASTEVVRRGRRRPQMAVLTGLTENQKKIVVEKFWELYT